MKMTKDLQGLANAMFAEAAADAAAPFRALANEIGTIVAKRKGLSAEGTKQGASLWDKFKTALSIAHEAGMSANSLKLGLAVACAEADVPTGSYRSYVSTVASMLADVNSASDTTIVEALALTIQQAREKYQDAEVKALREARARLAEVTKSYTADQLDDLVAQLTPAAEGEGEGERKAA